MKALVITPRNNNEFKFFTDLFKKLGIGSSVLNREDVEDLGMSKLMSKVNKKKKVVRSEIIKKLTA